MKYSDIPRLGRSLFAGGLVALAVLFGSCTEKKPTEPVYVISATSGEHGTVSPLGSVTVKPGESQAFSFIPDSGYSVVTVRVDGAVIPPVPGYTFSDVRGNHYLYVSFSHVYTITATAGAHGQISPSGTIIVPEGESRQFTITPDFGYKIDDVLVDGISVGRVSTYTFNLVTADHSIVASFTRIPFVLTADNGSYYKGAVGSSLLAPDLVITASDSVGVVAGQWIHLNRFSGDGLLGADSLETDGTGKIRPVYTFSGISGSATIRAIWPSNDTLDVFLRASVLEPGITGQGQYVKIGDTYKTVKILNGPPERVDIDPNQWLTYAVYESSLGVVVILSDIDQDEIASDFETVHGVIVNGVFTGKFANGIGIGSTVGAMASAFGPADTTYLDPSPPAAWVYLYRSLGLVIFADQATPSRIFEIHINQPSSPANATRRASAPQTQR